MQKAELIALVDRYKQTHDRGVLAEFMQEVASSWKTMLEAERAEVRRAFHEATGVWVLFQRRRSRVVHGDG